MGEHCRTRVQEKLKVRLNISVFFTDLARGGGGGDARGKCGRVRGPQPVLFYARFKRTTSDPARGRGDTGTH